MIERPESLQPIPPHAIRVFEGKIFEIYQWEQELFDGTTTIFEKAKRTHDSVVAIPILPDGKLLITEDEQPGRAKLVTFPGGQMDTDEDPQAAVLRELEEETGYTSSDISYWFGFQPEAKVDYAVYFFIARNCVPDGEIHHDAGERIKVRTVTLDELIELSDEPRFQNTALAPLLISARYNADAKAKLAHQLGL
ncbi:MAG: NUDIX hydrolase [Bacillota bacterium]